MNITNKTSVKSYEGNRLEWSLNFRAKKLELKLSNCILDIRWCGQPIFCKPYCIHMLWLVMGNKSFKGIPVSDLSHLPPKDYAQKLSFNKWACRFNFGFSCVIITFSKKRYNLQAGVNFLTNMCTIISEHVKIHYKLNLENWKDERGRVSNEITY